MNKLALALAAASCALLSPAPALANDESPAAIAAANSMAMDARDDVEDVFGDLDLKPGKYVWTERAGDTSLGTTRVVVSLSDQKAYVYRGDTLVAVSTVSTGKPGHDTPLGRFDVLAKKETHFSRKYNNAPMPFMQRIDNYGVALHAGNIPGYAASHGCVRLPMAFAKKLYAQTKLGTEVLIAA